VLHGMQRAPNEDAIQRARMLHSHEGLLLDGSFRIDVRDVLERALLLDTDSTRVSRDERYQCLTLTVMTSLGLALGTNPGSTTSRGSRTTNTPIACPPRSIAGVICLMSCCDARGHNVS